jgi:hypothetical protein
MTWTAERLAEVLDRMMQQDASEVALQIGEFKQIHREWALNRYGNAIKIFEDGFEVLANVIFNANYLDKSSWPSHRRIQFFLAADALKRLFRAMEDAVEGFCGETIVLTRSVYETFLRVVFVSCFPKDWTTAMFKPQKGQVAFNATNFPREQLRVDWDFFYKTHSIVSHNIYDAMRRLGEPQEFVGLELRCDDKMMTIALNSLTFTPWALLHVSCILFLQEARLIPEARARIATTDEGLEGTIALMPNRYAKTAEDVLKIGRIVRAAENGQDWRQVA